MAKTSPSFKLSNIAISPKFYHPLFIQGSLPMVQTDILVSTETNEACGLYKVVFIRECASTLYEGMRVQYIEGYIIHYFWNSEYCTPAQYPLVNSVWDTISTSENSVGYKIHGVQYDTGPGSCFEHA